MKKYTRAALDVICEYYEDVECYFPEILNKSKDELTASYHYSLLTEAACDMMLGPYDSLYDLCDESHSIQYYQYQQIRPYAKALGVRLGRGYAQICKEGDYCADRAIDEMIELITDALMQGIKDNWEYLNSDEW